MKATLNGLKESDRILAEIVCFLRLGGATFGVGNVDNVLSDSLDRRRRGRRGDQIAGMVPDARGVVDDGSFEGESLNYGFYSSLRKEENAEHFAREIES